MFDPVTGLGEVWTFRFYGFFSLFVLILYAAVQILCFRESDEPRKTAEGGTNLADQGNIISDEQKLIIRIKDFRLVD